MFHLLNCQNAELRHDNLSRKSNGAQQRSSRDRKRHPQRGRRAYANPKRRHRGQYSAKVNAPISLSVASAFTITAVTASPPPPAPPPAPPASSVPPTPVSLPRGVYRITSAEIPKYQYVALGFVVLREIW